MKKKLGFGLLTLGVICLLAAASKERIPLLQAERFVVLRIPEPSDLCMDANGTGFYIVSDNAILYHTDLEGNVLKSTGVDGIDFEAVMFRNNQILVMDETPRKILFYDPNTFEKVRQVPLNYSGGRNKGFEAITYNFAINQYIAITERDPVYIRQLNDDFAVTNEVEFTHARDISAATFHQGHLWLLSDEDMTIFKLHPQTFKVIAKWRVKVHNPEGLAFDDFGNMYILSDDMERLYYFKAPTE
jgi:uncharacterized protein YjiK